MDGSNPETRLLRCTPLERNAWTGPSRSAIRNLDVGAVICSPQLFALAQHRRPRAGRIPAEPARTGGKSLASRAEKMTVV